MFRKFVTVPVLALLAAGLLPADFSYQETSKITGGAMAAMMNVAGIFSKNAREPIVSTVAVKGDRMVRKNANQIQIIDVRGETITMVDLQKKTYTVMTFAQMKQMMEEMAQKAKDSKREGAEMQFKVSANATGNTKNISGFDAREMVIKINMEMTDQKSGQKGDMVVTTHVWVAANVPGFGELRDFQRRMAEKFAFNPASGFAAVNADVAKGMAEAYKEIAKLDGAPVLQIVSMGPEGSAPPDGAVPQPVAQQQTPKPSLGGALGGALGGRFGGLGKKRAPEAQQEAPQAGAPAQGSGSLMDMTTESSNFSTASQDGGMFEVPAGFKEVKPKK